MKTFMLIYDYVDDMLERRAPHRPAHLDYVGGFEKRGDIVLGGPFLEPADGAAIIFRADSAAFVENFVTNDPYKHAGLIKSYRVKEWMLVAGAERLEDVIPRPLAGRG